MLLDGLPGRRWSPNRKLHLRVMTLDGATLRRHGSMWFRVRGRAADRADPSEETATAARRLGAPDDYVEILRVHLTRMRTA